MVIATRPHIIAGDDTDRGRCSMAEVARPGDEHRAVGRIDHGHGLGVAHGAARLGEGAHAGRQAHLDRVREREERIRGARGTDRGRRARASRGPSRRPAAPRPRARSGRCPSRRAGARARARSRSRSRRGPGARRGPGRAAPRRSARAAWRRSSVAGASVTMSGVGHQHRATGRADRADRRGGARRRPASSDASRSSTSTRRFGFVARTSSASAV